MSSDLPTLNSKIRLKEKILIQELQGEAVLLDLDTGVYFGLDEVGTRIWQLAESTECLADIAQAIESEFDVAPEKCAQDLLDLVTQLQKNALVVTF